MPSFKYSAVTGRHSCYLRAKWENKLTCWNYFRLWESDLWWYYDKCIRQWKGNEWLEWRPREEHTDWLPPPGQQMNQEGHRGPGDTHNTRTMVPHSVSVAALPNRPSHWFVLLLCSLFVFLHPLRLVTHLLQLIPLSPSKCPRRVSQHPVLFTIITLLPSQLNLAPNYLP